MLRLDLLSQASIPELVEHGRRQPYLVTPMANEETLVLHWPAEFAPESVPEDVDLQSEFGAHHAKLKVQDGAISFSRRLSVEDHVLDPEQYAKFRQFLLAVAKADQRTMVLRKP